MKTITIHQRINNRAKLVRTRNYFLNTLKRQYAKSGGYDANLLNCLSQAIGNVNRTFKATATATPVIMFLD